MNINDSYGPNSELLRTFSTVAELGNVTLAAKALAKTQSAISVKIRQLEEQLSVSLFNRLARGVELTQEGHRLLPIAKKALVEIDRAGDLFKDKLVGQIRVGIPDDYNESILEEILAEFCVQHREVEVFIQSGCTSGYPDAIDKGNLDLAIYSGAPGKNRNAFYTEPTVWVASQDFVLDEQNAIPLAIFDRQCRWRSVPTDAIDKTGKEWRIAYLTVNFSSYKAAIRSGLAIGIMAKSTVEDTFRILQVKDGLPGLPQTSRCFLRSKTASPDITDAMQTAILNAVKLARP